MADETKVKQLSDDEYNRMMHGSFAHEAIKSAMAQGEQAQQQNVQANAAPGIVQSQPAIPPKINLPKISKSVEPPVAGQPDANAVAQQVNKAITNLQISTPPPKPPSSADHLLDQIASNWQIPATVVGIGTAIAGASYLMNRKSLKDRDITNRVEPTLNEKDLYKPDTTAPISKTKSDFLNDYSEQKYGAPLAKLEEISGGKIKSLADVDVVGGTFSKGGNITVNPAGAFTPKADYTKTPVAPTEVAPVATVAPVTPVEKPAPKKPVSVKSFKSEADIPKGYVFRPDVGNLDRSLFNILGPEGRQYAKDVLNEGKMFGEYKGADYNEKVKQLIGAYGEKLKEITPSIDLTTREGRIAVGAPHTTNYGASGFGTAAKVAGVAGTLFAIADIANAAQQGKYGQAAVQGVDVATDYIPMVAQLKQGLAPTEAGAPGVSKQTIQSSALLGSPYAQTEWAKNQRLKEKAGAGRGIAPPSAYMR
jgi:hypothetical protein